MGAGHPLDSLVRLGAQYLLQKALAPEEEVEEFLGRGYYRHPVGVLPLVQAYPITAIEAVWGLIAVQRFLRRSGMEKAAGA
jgi:hypothetical protein